MDGHQYEHQCAKMLRRKGFSRVTVTRGSGDQGIDVIAYSGGKKYGIQCKYYTLPVGNHAVQEAYAGAKYYNCNVAVVMTNNTFTQSAKDLARKTNVFLWDRNKIPLGINSFWLTKFIGIFVCVVGILGLITMWGVDNIKLPVLQAMELVFLVLGGLCAIFEYRNWGIAFLSSIFYLLSALMNLMFHIITRKVIGYDLILLFTITIITFMRADYLHNKTNGYHIWKNCFKQFIENNFLQGNPKEAKENADNIPETNQDSGNFEGDTLSRNEGWKKISTELSDALKDYGNLYVNLFNERFYVNSSLINSRTIENNSTEFIIKCETLEQAKYVVTHENELNQNLKSTHKMTLLANNCISLIVVRNRN